MRIPDGWQFVSDYCIRRGDFTITKIGGVSGWTYELWRMREQLQVNLSSAEAALDAHRAACGVCGE